MYFFITGAFPLSDASLMTEKEREIFLPATETFISVLDQSNLDQREIYKLIKRSETLFELSEEIKRETISSSISNMINSRSG